MTAAKSATLPMRRMAALTGVSPVTLRAWERRYGLIRPARTAKGHRLYSSDQVERIRRVLALMERGVPIGHVRKVLDAEPAPEPEGAAGHWRGGLERMADAIARFDEQELDRVYDEALSMHSAEQVTRRLVLPLLAHLGVRWRDLPGAIAEEHFFATYLRSKLGARLQHRMRYATGPRLLAACAPGEQHEIGLLLFALEAHAAGLRTVLLGADTPLEDIAIARHRGNADAIIVSSSVEPGEEFFTEGLPRLVRKAGTPVFIGGATAERHGRAVEAAGAVPVGVDLENGVRLICARLAREARP